jgi:hypothetical protein
VLASVGAPPATVAPLPSSVEKPRSSSTAVAPRFLGVEQLPPVVAPAHVGIEQPHHPAPGLAAAGVPGGHTGVLGRHACAPGGRAAIPS